MKARYMFLAVTCISLLVFSQPSYSANQPSGTKPPSKAVPQKKPAAKVRPAAYDLPLPSGWQKGQALKTVRSGGMNPKGFRASAMGDFDGNGHMDVVRFLQRQTGNECQFFITFAMPDGNPVHQMISQEERDTCENAHMKYIQVVPKRTIKPQDRIAWGDNSCKKGRNCSEIRPAGDLIKINYNNIASGYIYMNKQTKELKYIFFNKTNI